MVSEKIEIGAEAELRNIIKLKILDGKKIYAMGNVANIAKLDTILKEYNKSIMAIVDNDQKKAGIYKVDDVNYKIITMEDFLKQEKEQIIMLIYSVRFWLEMKEQMLKLGLRDQENLFVLEELTLDKKRKYVQLGYNLLKKYKQKYGDDVYILVFYGPIGDNFLFAGYLERYLEKNEITNYVCLGNKITEKVLKIYRCEKFERISMEEMLALEYLYMFLGDDINCIKILQIWEFCFHFNRSRMRLEERFDFSDTYRHYIYNLDACDTLKHPEFIKNEEKIKNEFEKKLLLKDNTVIISPYAYSIWQQPPREFWLILAEKLVKKGKRIAVNINPQLEENFITESEELFFSLEESVSYLEYAGNFIGMRSGFCDVISSAKCKKIILYPERITKEIDLDRHRPDMDFGSLKRMKLTDEAVEIEFNYQENMDYWEQMAEKIVSEI